VPDFFSANAASYDRSRPSRLSDSARDAIVQAAHLPAHGRVLDVAAGTGRVAVPLAGLGYRVVAADRSKEMLDVLRGKAATEKVTAVVASGAALPFGNRTFDAVVIARLLYLTREWQHILIEALRVLAAGGHLLHEWANGTASEPSVLIKEHLRTLLEDAGVVEPFHPGVRRESDVNVFLSQRGYAVVDAVEVPLDGEMSVGAFLRRIEAGVFSYTWSAPAAVKDRCTTALQSWASERFDMNAPAFAATTSWKVFEAIPSGPGARGSGLGNGQNRAKGRYARSCCGERQSWRRHAEGNVRFGETTGWVEGPEIMRKDPVPRADQPGLWCSIHR
jgi:SAM-dependent methyltransferase